MLVRVRTELPGQRRNIRRLRKVLRRAMRSAAPPLRLEVSAVLVDDDRMRELNERYLGRDEPTDVIAFPQLSPEELSTLSGTACPRPEPLGDIAICVPVARAQALERGIEETREIDLLAVHGLLHLLGYEDNTPGGAKAMSEMQARLLGTGPEEREKS